MSTKILSLITVAVFLPLIGCTTNTITGQKEFTGFKALAPGVDEQKSIGDKTAPEVEKQLGGKIPNEQIQNYVNQVGQRLAAASGSKDFQFRYAALNDTNVNAFALPGGYVYITKGMLQHLKNEAELAAILGHETAHVTQQHSAQAMGEETAMNLLMQTVLSGQQTSQYTQMIAQLSSQLIGLKYSRSHETAADLVGLDYLVKAGYNPNGMLETMQILQQVGGGGGLQFLSTHPNPANRLQDIQQQINKKYAKAPRPDENAPAFQQNVLANLK